MISMKEMPLFERPRERLERLGADALSAAELLAVILGSGSQKEPVLKLARTLLSTFSSLEEMSRSTIEELMTVSGVGRAKALKLQAAFELSKRISLECSAQETPVQSPLEAFQIAKNYLQDEKRELFLTLLLNVKSKLIGVEVISIGTLNATMVHPREVFHKAIRRKAHSIIAVHNHPSGDLEPSPEDIALTKRLIAAADLISIPLRDHLIITKNRYASLKEKGLCF